MILDGCYHAASVASAVQQGVTEAVSAATGLQVRAVTVHITEVNLAPLLS